MFSPTRTSRFRPRPAHAQDRVEPGCEPLADGYLATRRAGGGTGTPTLFLCTAALLAAALPAHADLLWTFETGPQGWTVTDHACSSSYAAILSSAPVSHAATGGHPGGYIFAADPSSNCYFFSSPPDLGDLRPLAGGVIEFSLRSTLSTWTQDNALVIVGASGVTLVAPITPIPDAAWRRYAIPIQPSAFRVNSLTGTPATPAQFDAVLSSVARLRISAEYGAVVQETTSLDSVAIRLACPSAACPPDRDCDAVIDSADITAFLSAWFADRASGTPGAGDFNQDNTVTSADITAFLSAWFSARANGC